MGKMSNATVTRAEVTDAIVREVGVTRQESSDLLDRTLDLIGAALMIGCVLVVLVLIAFLGMTVDLGRLFITKTELSNAADACALAAAAELTGEKVTFGDADATEGERLDASDINNEKDWIYAQFLVKSGRVKLSL